MRSDSQVRFHIRNLDILNLNSFVSYFFVTEKQQQGSDWL